MTLWLLIILGGLAVLVAVTAGGWAGSWLADHWFAPLRWWETNQWDAAGEVGRARHNIEAWMQGRS